LFNWSNQKTTRVVFVSVKPIELAIKTAGGQTALANALGVSQSRVWNWLNRDPKIPAEMVLRMEAATGISRHKLRPDIYPLGRGVNGQ
jgi:DNA-binding transcriptional regulator YdaS (Cro superfamily)